MTHFSWKQTKHELVIICCWHKPGEVIYLHLKSEPTFLMSSTDRMNHSVMHSQTMKIQKVTLQNTPIGGKNWLRNYETLHSYLTETNECCWPECIAVVNALLQKDTNGGERRWTTHRGFYFTVRNATVMLVSAGINHRTLFSLWHMHLHYEFTVIFAGTFSHIKRKLLKNTSEREVLQQYKDFSFTNTHSYS